MTQFHNTPYKMLVNPLIQCLISIFLFNTCTFLVPVAGQNKVTLKLIEEHLKKLKQGPLASAQVGFCLENIADQKILYDIRSKECLTPASNLKLLTTATALETLGENFVFKTTIGYTGQLENGTLTGDLLIIGGGDPTLGSERMSQSENFLDTWVSKIKEKGIKAINGNIVANAALFGIHQIPDGWMWADIGNYYGAAACALNYHENFYTMKLKPGSKVGDSVQIITTEPVIDHVIFENLLTTAPAGTGDRAFIYGAPSGTFKYIKGTVPKGPVFSVKGAVSDPAKMLGDHLYQKLISSGIVIAGNVVSDYYHSKSPDDYTVLFQHSSPILKEVVYHTNQKSLNLYAECLFNFLSIQSQGSFDPLVGEKVIKKIWHSIDTAGMNITDGSGLSLTNHISPRQVTDLLSVVAGKQYADSFINSLPLSGRTGTLARLTRGTRAEGRIRAKTGTQTGVSCYSGFIMDKEKPLYSFSLMVNHYNSGEVALFPWIEKLMVLFADL